MKLADKPCYPCVTRGIDVKGYGIEIVHTGLTFKERLVIALASNPAIVRNPESTNPNYPTSEVALKQAKALVIQADAIIAELEKEK